MSAPARVPAIARLLDDARRQGCPVPRVTRGCPDLTVEEAYAVQSASAMLRQALGARPRGYKIGLTTAATRRQFGMTEPTYGVLFDDMFRVTGVDVPATSLIAPRVEPELVVVLDRSLSGPGITARDVGRDTALFVLGLEVIDSRVDGWDLTAADLVADNSAGGLAVLGDRRITPAELPSGELDVVLRSGDAVIGRGTVLVTDVTQAVAWLANTLAAAGLGLDEGAVIFPGSCLPAIAPTPDVPVRADFADVGSVVMCLRSG
jgi:2-keto-4-pentenoate hydratase